jgi:hypothetical protein
MRLGSPGHVLVMNPDPRLSSLTKPDFVKVIGLCAKAAEQPRIIAAIMIKMICITGPSKAPPT